MSTKKTPVYTVAPTITSKIEKELAYLPPLVRQLLFTRGITEKGAAEHFLKPDFEEGLHNPYLLNDMVVAAARIFQAFESNERIAIYGDFDADGIPAVALLLDFFRTVGYENVTTYIPHRHSEGYGFHVDAVDTLAKDGVSLIITVDVGITDVETVIHARELGVDVIVTDHHLPNDTLPDAIAVLNPNRVDSTYPFGGLSGSGVAFKLVQALTRFGREQSRERFSTLPEGFEKWLLDLVAIATVADMVPLTDENRVLVHYGLLVLRKSRRVGIRALCQKLRMNQSMLSEDDIGFMIAPRINAASRMDEPEQALELFTTTDEVVAMTIATHLEKLNNQRKGTVASMVREIKKKLAETPPDTKVIVAGNPDWRPSLLGLAANSVVETYGRPVCLWGREGTGVLKGSCRSDGSVSIVDLFKASSDVLLSYGGHAGAGGFAVSHEYIHTIQDVFSKAYTKIKNGDTKEVLSVDTELTLADVSRALLAQICHLAPFGRENAKPNFLFKGVAITEVRVFGKDNNHIEISVQGPEGQMQKATRFFATAESFTTKATEHSTVDLLATLDESKFGGRSTLQLRIIDIV